MEIEKKCTKCGEAKPLTEFSPHERCLYGRNPVCKVCKSEYAKAYYYTNKATVTRKAREKRRQRSTEPGFEKYSKDQAHRALKRYRAMRLACLIHFGGKCAACGLSDTRALGVDHVKSNGSDERKIMANYTIMKRAVTTVPGVEYQLLCGSCNAIKRYTHDELRRVYTHEELEPFPVSVLHLIKR